MLVKKSELSRIISTSPRTIDAWVAKGLIPFIAVSSRLHLFDVHAVQEALAQRFGVQARNSRE
jgi:DNA-binding transcriptional MerR regulator